MDEQRPDDLLELTYNSSVPIQDVALKTYRKRLTIEKGGGRGSGRSVLMARHDDDDDDDFQTIQFSINTQFNCQKHFYFKLFSLIKQFYFKQFSVA